MHAMTNLICLYFSVTDICVLIEKEDFRPLDQYWSSSFSSSMKSLIVFRFEGSN